MMILKKIIKLFYIHRIENEFPVRWESYIDVYGKKKMEENSYIKTELMKEEEDIKDAFLNTFNLYKNDFEFSVFEQSKQYWLLSDPLSNETFNNLIDYFENKEEFEKCHILMDKKGKRQEFWKKVSKTGKYKKIFKTKYKEDD